MKNEVVKNTKFNTLKTTVNNLEKKIPDATTLIHINQYNTDKQNLEKKIEIVDIKIHNVSGLVTTTVLNTKASMLVKNADFDTIIIEIENKVTDHDHAKYITTLKQVNFVRKTDFDNKLISLNRNITSNKKKYLVLE